MRLRRLALEAALVALVIAAGVALRLQLLDAPPFWVDEAESSINALTILQSGYPTDHYLGIPIYENTLVKPWPGHPEYEFRDISYSGRGFATYHGWLPLYSIAASFALHGIQPDLPKNGVASLPSLDQMRRRTRAARLPAVIYGAVFMLVCYLAGSVLYGRDAGVSALLGAVALSGHIEASVQARYYSALITLSSLATLVVWLILTKGRWKDYLAGAAVFLLLFFTHLVTFAAAVAVLALLTPVILFRCPSAFRKLAAFGLILLTGALPWVMATGFLTDLGRIPPARSLLSFPGDLLLYPIGKPAHLVVFSILVLLMALALYLKFRLPAQFTRPFQQARAPVFFLSLWILAAYTTFVLLIPAASLDAGRLKLCYWGPMLLLEALFSAAVARAVWPRFSPVIAPAVSLVLLVAAGVHFGHSSSRTETWRRLAALTAYMERMGPAADTRWYATPNSHLVLSFYTGVPFQSIAPIRKSYLDGYPGEVVYVDFGDILPEDGPLNADQLRLAAWSHGQRLSREEARNLSRRLNSLDYREAIEQRVAGPPAAPEGVPGYAQPLLEEARAARRRSLASIAAMPVLRGYPVTSWFEFGAFFYRFVDPVARLGPRLNYAARLRGARGDVLSDAGWIVYRSAPQRDREAGIEFRLLP